MGMSGLHDMRQIAKWLILHRIYEVGVRVDPVERFISRDLLSENSVVPHQFDVRQILIKGIEPEFRHRLCRRGTLVQKSPYAVCQRVDRKCRFEPVAPDFKNPIRVGSPASRYEQPTLAISSLNRGINGGRPSQEIRKVDLQDHILYGASSKSLLQHAGSDK